MVQTLSESLKEASIPDSRVRNPQFLAPSPSIILDVVRFLAALTVAVGHLSKGYFTTGWSPVLMKFAVGSVSVFFILSGFMIRYVTRVKYGDLRRYTVDRFARIYSVALPFTSPSRISSFVSSGGSPPRPFLYTSSTSSSFWQRRSSPIPVQVSCRNSFS
jgi:peptidoglycan/LPS O-acetylase OafA/YrhL